MRVGVDNPLVRELQRSARPMAFALAAMAASNAAEIYSLSRLGPEALAGFGSALPVLLAVEAFAIGLGAGASSLYARSGATPQQQPLVAAVALVLTLGSGALLALILGLRLPQITAFFAEGNGAERAAFDYLSLWLFGAPLLATNAVACALLRAADRCRLAALVMLAFAVTNAGLAPLLTLGGFGAAGLGMKGAALAQALSAGLASALLVGLASRAKRPATTTAGFGQQTAIARQVLRVGLPATLANLLMPIGALFIVQQLWQHGQQYVAAYSLAVRIEALVLVPFLAYSSVTGPLFGKRLAGVPNSSSIAVDVQACRALCLRQGAVIALLMLLLPLSFPIGLSSCSVTIPALRDYVLLVPLSYGAYGLIMVCNAAFNGMGMALLGVAVTALRCLFFLIPLTWLFGYILGGTGVFLAISASNLASAFFAYRLMQLSISRPLASISTSPTP